MISLSTEQWQLHGIEGVLFDKDGTLIDSHTYWGRIIERRAAALIACYGLPRELAGDLCRAMGFSRDSRRLLPEGPIALVSREEVIEAVLNFLLPITAAASTETISRLFAQEHEAFLEEIHGYITLLPGVVYLLEQLRRHGVRTAVVTTDTVANTNETLRHVGIAHLFDVVIGKESTKEPKVTGAPATAALKQLGLEAGQAVCIGDAPMDLIMARNSGLMGGIGVATGQLPPAELRTHSDYIITTLHELAVHGTM